MKLIIAGGRDFECSLVDFSKEVIHVVKYIKTIEIVQGDCPTGADKLARELATIFDLKLTSFPADWDTHKLAAGPIRNKQMATYGEYLLAFWDGKSRGTSSMIHCARNAGIPVNIKRY